MKNDEIIGLKTEVKRQVKIKTRVVKHSNFKTDELLKDWKKLYDLGENVEENIWRYADEVLMIKKVDSSIFNVYTTIGEYTSKKGYTSMAHYTSNKWYYGSVQKLGNEPVSYIGRFEVSKRYFKVDLTKLENVKDVDELFVPIPYGVKYTGKKVRIRAKIPKYLLEKLN